MIRRLVESGLIRRLEPPPLEPVEEPPRNKRRESAVSLALFIGWLVLVGGILATMGNIGAERSGAPAPWLALTGVGTWVLAEWLARGLGMVWPGSMLGLLGPISFAYALALAVPDIRVLPGLDFLTVVYGLTALGMIVYLFRFRLAGLVSPIVSFSVIALFLLLKGSNPANWRDVEGISPRGLLAALVDQPLFMALFGTLSLGAVVLARRLDLYGDWFGIQAARPLHIVGAGVLALVLGRIAAWLPAGLDVAVLLALYLAGFLWAMRIDRVAVMVAAWFAMARSLVLSVTEPLGLALDMQQWAGIHSIVLGLGLVLWGRYRQRVFVPIGWTMQPRNIRWNWPERVIWPPPNAETDPRARALDRGA